MKSLKERFSDISFENPILIPWSGGMDSTLLVYELSHYIKENNIAAKIITVSVSGTFLAAEKVDREKAARKELADIFRQKGFTFLSHIEQSITATGKESLDAIVTLSDGKRYSSTPQVMSWLTNSLMWLPDGGTLLMSYLKDDKSFGLCRDRAEAYIASLGNLLQRNFHFVFPYITDTEKFDVMKKLHKAGLLEKTHSCEHPILLDGEWKNCSFCGSCMTNMAALMKNFDQGTWVKEYFKEQFNPEFFVMAQSVGFNWLKGVA